MIHIPKIELDHGLTLFCYINHLLIKLIKFKREFMSANEKYENFNQNYLKKILLSVKEMVGGFVGAYKGIFTILWYF